MIIPDGYAQVNLIWGGVSLPLGAQITFGVTTDSPASEDPAEIADVIRTAWAATTLKTLYSSTVSMTGILVKLGPNDTGPSGLFAGTGAGTAGNEMTTPNVAVLVQKNTAFGGRSGRGRMFLPFLQENSVSSAGVITEGTRTTYQTQLNAFRTAIATEGQTMTLLHGGHGGAITEPIPITSLSVSPTAATQRRRLRR
jgi:hypothetical protein